MASVLFGISIQAIAKSNKKSPEKTSTFLSKEINLLFLINILEV